MLLRFFLVCFAGGCGTGLRYLVVLGSARAFGTGFPYATLAVNVLGCFLIAGVMHAALATTHIPETTRIVLTTGFMGGLTTYSSFNQETMSMVREGAYRAAMTNVGLTLALCFVAGLGGLAASRAVFD